MIANTIWDRIVLARTEKGLDPRPIAIAKEMGVSPSAITKWRAGKGLRLAHALEIAYQTGVCVEWLLTGRPPKRPISEGSSVDELLSEFENLPPEDQQEILDFARFRKARTPRE